MEYRQRLEALIDEMSRSVEYWLRASYRVNPPRIAMDATPYSRIKRSMENLGERWLTRFDEEAPAIAERYVRACFNASDASFKAALKRGGWTVKFEMTPTMRDAFDATLGENVALIRSIPEQYLSRVEGIVSRSYTAGRDLGSMVDELQKIRPMSDARAALIARDQTRKANAVVSRARSLQLGITRAIWIHSHGGKTPRPGHLKADGKIYEIAKGCLIDGEYIQPGELINCRCVSRPVIPGLQKDAR